jgi:hypothetical protein
MIVHVSIFQWGRLLTFLMLPPSRKSECLAVMRQLSSYRIATMFALPVDPVRDSCPNYFDIVRHPMDLGTITAKLQNNEYATVSEWQRDVALIWENAAAFNGPNSVVAILARQLQLFFKDLTEYITVDEKSDWLNKLYDLKSQISTIRGQSPKQLQAQKPPKTKLRDSQQPKPPKQQKQAKLHKLAKGGPHKPPKPPPPHQPLHPTRSQSVQLPQPFTRDQIVQLTEDVRALAVDERVMEQIVELIKRHEPQLMDGQEEVEIDVDRLRIGTLSALRKLVDRLSM